MAIWQVLRKNARGERLQYPAPEPVVSYSGGVGCQGGMGGVDAFDKIRTSASSIRASWFPNKAWLALFWAIIDMLLANITILMKMLVPSANTTRYNVCKRLHSEMLEYAHQVEDLFGEAGDQKRQAFRSRNKDKRRKSSAGGGIGMVISPQIGGHVSVNNNRNARRQCPVCKWSLSTSVAVLTKGGKAAKGRQVVTMCNHPDCLSVPLCNKPPKASHGTAVTCFQLWHSASWRRENEGVITNWAPKKHKSSSSLQPTDVWSPYATSHPDDEVTFMLLLWIVEAMPF